MSLLPLLFGSFIFTDYVILVNEIGILEVSFMFEGVSARLNESWFALDGVLGTLRLRLCKMLSGERLLGL